MERSLTILGSGGHAGLIVQLTLMSSERMKPIQDLLIRRGRFTSVSFPRRPQSIDGIERPVAIILSAPSHSQNQFLTSRISRFYTEERPNALSTLDLGQHNQRAHGHRIAKLGRDIELSIFAKISKPELHSIEELIQKDSLHPGGFTGESEDWNCPKP